MTLGQWGETIAERYLKKKGYEILERNFRCRSGELDIIALDDTVLVFIEVKTRKNQNYGMPCEAVNSVKLRHIKRTADYFKLHCRIPYKEERLDVIEILVKDGHVYLHHMENVIG